MSSATALQRFLRLPAVVDASGLSESSIYELMSENKFPKPVPLQGRRVAWIESDIIEWQQARIAAREQGLSSKLARKGTKRAKASNAAEVQVAEAANA